MCRCLLVVGVYVIVLLFMFCVGIFWVVLWIFFNLFFIDFYFFLRGGGLLGFFGVCVLFVYRLFFMCMCIVLLFVCSCLGFLFVFVLFVWGYCFLLSLIKKIVFVVVCWVFVVVCWGGGGVLGGCLCVVFGCFCLLVFCIL